MDTIVSITCAGLAGLHAGDAFIKHRASDPDWVRGIALASVWALASIMWGLR